VTLVAGNVLGVPITITDTTAGTATNNGAIAGGEYVGSSVGINSGFGNVIGSNSAIHVDSSSLGALNFGVQSGGGNFNDAAVIYIDSITGGVADTTGLEDTNDPGRSAISGDGDNESADQSEITFGANFRPDYAISIDNGFAGLFQLTPGGDGSLTFVASGNLNPTNNAAAQQREIDITLANIGLTPGGSFKYVVTYLNPGNSFRSDEFHGVAQATANSGNIGQAPITLADTDFNVFNSIPEPSSIGVLALGGAALLRRKGR
jgi:hypothetical protein